MKIIMTKSFKENFKSSAVVITENGEEVVVDNNEIDQEIENQFGEGITKRRGRLGLIQKDRANLRKRNPAGFNYLTRGQRQIMRPDDFNQSN